MTLPELLQKKIEEEQIDSYSDYVERLQSILKKYNCLQLDSILSITPKELFELALLSQEEKEVFPSFSLQEIGKMIEEGFFVESKDANKLGNVEEKTTQDVISYIESVLLSLRLQKVPHRKKVLSNKEREFYDWIYEFTIGHEQVMSLWKNLLSFRLGIMKKVKIFSNLVLDFKNNGKYSILLSDMQEFALENHFDKMMSQLQEKVKEKRSVLKTKLHKVKDYQELLEEMNHGKVYYTIEASWKKYDKDIQIALLEHILAKQKERYQQLLEEEKALTKTSEVRNLLLQKGICPTLVEELEKENLEVESLSTTLDLLQKGGFPISSMRKKECFLSILHLDKENISTLLSYIKTKAISLPFLEEHPEIFISKEEDQEKGTKEVVLENFRLLKEENALFPEDFNSNILLLEPVELQKRIALAKSYELFLSGNPYVFHLLEEPAMFDFIDFAIEHQLPLEEVVRLKVDKENIAKLMKRLLIAENFGLEIITADQEEIAYSIQTGNSFLVPDEMLDYMVEDSTIWEKKEETESLLDSSDRLVLASGESVLFLDEEYLDDEKEKYNFGGTFISRNKVLRNLKVLEGQFPNLDSKEILYQAMIYHSLLSTQDLKNIKEELFVKEKKLTP